MNETKLKLAARSSDQECITDLTEKSDIGHYPYNKDQ